MRKTTLLNSEVSYEISKMGHFDTLTIGDAGLPVPNGVRRIDLAVSLGIPGFVQVFEAVTGELKVQRMIIASEMEEQNSALYNYITRFCETNCIDITKVSHKEFKELSAESKAVIRTGECRPYANVILESGVTF